MKASGSSYRWATATLWAQRAFYLSSPPAATTALPVLEHPFITPAQACADFSRQSWDNASSPPAAFWGESDCAHVWSSWAGTLPASFHLPYPDREALMKNAAEMRRRGRPCLVESVISSDGVGSTTMRHLATWMLAEEIGCDWVKPGWGTPRVAGTEGGASVYCHSAATSSEMQGLGDIAGMNVSAGELDKMAHRCSLANWLEYFNLEGASVELPTNALFRVVEADAFKAHELESALDEIEVSGLDHLEWDRLRIVLHRSHASNYLAAVGSWDEWKRQVVRETLRKFRENFHQFPRPWYNETPECEYESSQLNFALHLRMGDRKEIEHVTFEYFQMLDTFMQTVSDAVITRGHAAPTFHVFSETLLPCPSNVNRTFYEFPVWPVEMDQVPPCISAETPTDCPEKKAGAAFCPPNRSGVFRVEGRPLILHIGHDVANALSCMIQADGLLMGCSTFGQLAGVLNRDGISFFSTGCSGLGTAVQYKMVPPLAVAERGYMWAPVDGSWRDPVLRSTEAFETALDELLRSKGMSL